MKTVLTVAITTILFLSGCGGGASGDANTPPETPQVPNTETTSVLINSAKSPTILSENQVKSNPGYTHLSASGSRYKFD